jgi:hypothetical protein
MFTMRQLIQQVGDGEVIVTGIDVIETDQGCILRVHLQSMNHSNVLAMTIDLPDEVSDQYDFQEAGAKWKEGLGRLSDHLRKN